jgi:ubiquinone biosynthesis protein
MRRRGPLTRLARLLRVLSAHGLSRLLAPLLVRHPRLAARLPPADLPPPERLRAVLEEMGGTFIKLGQMLSLQPDILPLAWCNALYNLLDRVAPFSYEEVRRIVREELGGEPEELFEDFSPVPLATASIGQVHRATFRGRPVAVKVQRPSVDEEFAGDVRLMEMGTQLIRALRLRPLYWLLEPLGEFIDWTREELDYRHEARYMDRLRANAADNPYELVPEVFWEVTTPRVLTSDFLDGVTVLAWLRSQERGDEVTARRLAATGFVPEELARHLIENFLGDAFRHGAFHADLHPANLMILPGNVVGYLDFGITGVLSTYSRQHLVAMTLAYTRADLDGMTEAFFRVSTFSPEADRTAFRRGMERLGEEWFTGAGPRRRLAKNFTLLMLDMLRLSRKTGIWPERDVIKYIRSAIAIDGLITRFAPGFDVGGHLQRVCESQLARQGLQETVSGPALLSSSAAISRLASDGPARLHALLSRLTAGELTVAAELPPAPPADRRVPLAAAAVLLALLAERAADPAAFGLNPFTALAALAAVAFLRLLPVPARPA